MTILFVFVLGAIIGSFIGALTFRWPKEMSIFDGRSICPRCHHQIRWYDNVPIFSYLILRGQCRDCKKPISKRYFLIELSTALLYTGAYLLYPLISSNLIWLKDLQFFVGLSVLLSVLSILAAIFVIDLEHQYIPDTLIFIMFVLMFGVFITTSNSSLYMYLAAGFGSSVFLLCLHLVTLGRGMGLGDVKLALAMGFSLGYPLAVIWMFNSFILGSLIGIMLITLKLAKFKQKIAFGPFLIVGYFVASLYGMSLFNWLAIL